MITPNTPYIKVRNQKAEATIEEVKKTDVTETSPEVPTTPEMPTEPKAPKAPKTEAKTDKTTTKKAEKPAEKEVKSVEEFTEAVLGAADDTVSVAEAPVNGDPVVTEGEMAAMPAEVLEDIKSEE